jgi:predicted nucleic acid-binding protein
MAAAGDADYLVTGDKRDLLSLKNGYSPRTPVAELS